jgi:DNA-binding NtrC family response regulator
MLHIALAGELADHLDAFQKAAVRTSVAYYPLGSAPVNPSRLDLVVYLEADAKGRKQVVQLQDGSALPPTIASAWQNVPTEADLDFCIQESLFEVYGFVVGYTEAMHNACRWVRVMTHPAGAALRLPFHISGETGTGKDLLAQAIHRLGPFREGRFVAVNLGAVLPDLVFSELFGHVAGSFTSALKDRDGAVRHAKDGVLFLDEIGDAAPEVQVALLRLLETGEYRPLGSDPLRRAETQVVTATNTNLHELARTGRFRVDLLHRVGRAAVHLPPLRERRDDIPLLVRIILRGKGVPADLLNDAACEELCRQDWPGNIRQLKAAVDRFALFHVVGGDDASPRWQELDPSLESASATEDSRTLAELRADFDPRILQQRLRRFGGDTQATADSLGISRRSVYELAHKLGLEVGKDRPR